MCVTGPLVEAVTGVGAGAEEREALATTVAGNTLSETWAEAAIARAATVAEMRITAVQTSMIVGRGVQVASEECPRTDESEVSGKKQAERGHTAAGCSLYKHGRPGCGPLVFLSCGFLTLFGCPRLERLLSAPSCINGMAKNNIRASMAAMRLAYDSTRQG